MTPTPPSLIAISALTGALLVFGVLARRSLHGGRKRFRRSVGLFVVYLVTLGVSQVFAPLGVAEWVPPLLLAARLFEALIVINLGALAFFDLLLPVVRVTLPDIVHDLTVGAAYLVAGGWLMRQIGVDVSSIVATSAVVTAVIGLSLQATLGNIFGGIALQLDDSIAEGDWIELENKVQGVVKKIRWRHTVVETRDWDTLIVPNGLLLSQTIKVLGKRQGEPVKRRMWIYFNVDFRFHPSTVVKLVGEALQNNPIPCVASDPKPHCICYDFARDGRDSFAYYAVRYWLTELATDDVVNSTVRERIYNALKRAEIPLAVPAATLFVAQDDPEHAERKRIRQHASFASALGQVELFSKMSDEEKAKLAERVVLAPFSPAEIITKQGAVGHWLYILTKGEVEVRVSAGNGTDRKVATLVAPSFFGEMALMTGSAREATVVALTQVECLRLGRDAFREVLEHRPEIAHEVSAILAHRRVELVAVQQHLDDEAKSRRIVSEKGQILAAIQRFFSMDEPPRS